MKKQVVVIGSNGTVGHALSEYFENKHGINVKKLSKTISEGSVPFNAVKDDIFQMLPNLSSDYVVYLAFGLTNLDAVARNKENSAELNVVAMMNIIECCAKVGARVVFLSSEQVFAGINGPSLETDTPCPINEYGRQKVLVEEILIRSNADWVIARMGSVISSKIGNNCLIEKTYNTLKKDSLIARDNFFSLTDLGYVVKILSLFASSHLKHHIYHVVSNKTTSRTALANIILRFSKNDLLKRYKLCDFDELSFEEERPKASYLYDTLIKDDFSVIYENKHLKIIQKIELLDQLAFSGTDDKNDGKKLATLRDLDLM